VVESLGFQDEAWVDENGSPITIEACITERIRRPNYDTLEVEITVNESEDLYEAVYGHREPAPDARG